MQLITVCMQFMVRLWKTDLWYVCLEKVKYCDNLLF